MMHCEEGGHGGVCTRVPGKTPSGMLRWPSSTMLGNIIWREGSSQHAMQRAALMPRLVPLHQRLRAWLPCAAGRRRKKNEGGKLN